MLSQLILELMYQSEMNGHRIVIRKLDTNDCLWIWIPESHRFLYVLASKHNNARADRLPQMNTNDRARAK